MASSIFQHRMTQMKVIAFALGGPSARDKIPTPPKAAPKTPETEQRMREQSLAKLGNLQRLVKQAARPGGQRAPTSARGDPGAATVALKAALDQVPTGRKKP